MNPLAYISQWSSGQFELKTGVLEYSTPVFSSNWSDDPGKETSIDFIRLKLITIMFGLDFRHQLYFQLVWKKYDENDIFVIYWTKFVFKIPFIYMKVLLNFEQILNKF